MPSSNPVEGWVRHSETCICRSCRGVRRRREREAAQVVRVQASEVAAHIAALKEAGWTQSAIAKAAGLSVGVVSKAKFPDSVLDLATAEKILAVG